MQLRPVNLPVEDGQLLTQGEILCREGCSGDDQAPDEPKERGDEDHKCEANHRKKDEPDDQAEWLMISLTASNSRLDEVFGRDNGENISDNKTAISAARSATGGCDHLLRRGRECRWPDNLIASCSCRAAA
jgi:hypothetical protein